MMFSTHGYSVFQSGIWMVGRLICFCNSDLVEKVFRAVAAWSGLTQEDLQATMAIQYGELFCLFRYKACIFFKDADNNIMVDPFNTNNPVYPIYTFYRGLYVKYQ